MGPEEFFNLDFGRQFVCLLISVPLGVLIGLAVNHSWGEMKKSSERRQLLELLIGTLKRNDWLLDQLSKYAQTITLPTFNLELVSLSAVASKKYEIIDDFDLCRTIDSVQYELSHTSRKIDMLCAIVCNPSAHKSPLFVGGTEGFAVPSFSETFGPQFRESIRTGIEQNKQLIAEVLPKLENALKKERELDMTTNG